MIIVQGLLAICVFFAVPLIFAEIMHGKHDTNRGF